MAAVQVDRIADHRQIRGHGPGTFSSARTPRISTRSRFLGGDAGAVVFRHDDEARLGSGVRRLRNADFDLRFAPLAGVVDQVAEQLDEIAGIAYELSVGLDFEFEAADLSCVRRPS